MNGAAPPSPASPPCLYIDIYSLSPPEKPPQDAAEDNPSLRPVLSSFSSFVYYYYFIIVIINN